MRPRSLARAAGFVAALAPVGLPGPAVPAGTRADPVGAVACPDGAVRISAADLDPAWEAGGLKITASRSVVLRGNRVERNGGPGLWCDIDCRDVRIEGNHAAENLGPGIFYEISYAAVIARNTLRLNGDPRATWFWDGDIQVAASEDVEVSDNDITVRPGGHAVVLVDQARERAQGGLYRTARNRVHDNRFTFQGAGSAGGVSDAEPESPNFRVIQTGGNSFDRNRYAFPPPRRPASSGATTSSTSRSSGPRARSGPGS